MNKIYPFKFLDAYDKDDAGLFFGRDEEINSLYQMVFQTNILLVYGASGTGKTSLIQCGLAGKFQSHDWLSLFIRRGYNINESLLKILTDIAGNEETEEGTIDLSSLFDDEAENKTQVMELSPLGKLFNSIYLNSFRPIYLIFDQFEELFILGKQEEQEIFITTVQEILKLEQPIKLIFSIREEFLGVLHNFEKAVPELLRKKLRVEPMNRDKVHQVIKGATASKFSNISLNKNEEVEILDAIFDKIRGNDKSLAIQLPYLQVYMDKLYLHITNDKTRVSDAVITMKALNEMGNIGDVLREFLDDQVKEIIEKLNKKYSKITIGNIWKILSPFATLEGTKEPISFEQLLERLKGSDKVLIKDVIQAFVESRILRYSEDGAIYELAHDTLARQIASKRTEEDIELLEVKQLIKTQLKQKKEVRELFSERQLHRIKPIYLSLNLNDEEKKLIRESKIKIAKTRLLKGIRNAALVISLLIVIIIISLQWHKANLATIQKYKAFDSLSSTLRDLVKTQKSLKENSEKLEASLIDLKEANRIASNALDSANIATRSKLSTIKRLDSTNKALDKTYKYLDLSFKKITQQQNENDSIQNQLNTLSKKSLSQKIAIRSQQLPVDSPVKVKLACLAYSCGKVYNANDEDPQVYNALSQAIKHIDGKSYPTVTNLDNKRIWTKLIDNDKFIVFRSDSIIIKSLSKSLTSIFRLNLSGAPFTDGWIKRDSSSIITTNNKNICLKHNISNLKAIKVDTLLRTKDRLRLVSYGPDNSKIALVGKDSLVMLWAKNKKIDSIYFPSRIRCIEFLDDRNILVGCENGIAYKSNLKNKNNIFEKIGYGQGRVQFIIKNLRNDNIIIGYSGNKIQIYKDSKFTDPPNTLSTRKPILFAVLNEKINKMAVAQSNNNILVIDLSNTDKRVQINDINARICGISLSDNGELLVDCAENNSNFTKSYNISSATLFDRIRKIKNEIVTEDEWKYYIGQNPPYDTVVTHYKN